MPETKDIALSLTLAETNAVLQALALRPYGEVAALIQKLQVQASACLNPSPPEAPGSGT